MKWLCGYSPTLFALSLRLHAAGTSLILFNRTPTLFAVSLRRHATMFSPEQIPH
jgi:hypothetical protein